MGAIIENKHEWNGKKISKAIFGGLGLLLIILYGQYVMKICTVWELGDEFGYLNNAAYLVGFNWKEVASQIGYHGFGYSIILMPLFYICDTGVELIRGVIVINDLLVFIIYVLLVSVFTKTYPDIKKNYISIAAFLVCLNPYLMTNANKITCEVMLTMWTLVMARCLIWALEKNKRICFIVLGCVSAYIFFIHTRAIVVMGVMCLLMIYLGFFKKIKIGSFISYFTTLLLFFGILYILKKYFIHFALASDMRDGQSVVNVLTGQDIFTRIVNLLNLDNIRLYICGFAARFFYLASSSGAVIIFGCIEFVKHIKRELLLEEKREAYYMCFIFMSFILTLAASVVYSGGVGSNLAYTMYGRYYEHSSLSVMFMGYIYLFNKKQSNTEVLASSLWIMICGLLTKTCSIYWENTNVNIDTARLAGITHAIDCTGDFNELCLFLILIQVFFSVIFLIMKHRTWYVGLVIVVCLCLIYKNDAKVMENILNVNNNAKLDVELTQFFVENEETKICIFVDSEYQYAAYYAREQVLLYDKTLMIVEEEELEEVQGSKYVISYLQSPYGRKKEEKGDLVFRGDCFGIYYR